MSQVVLATHEVGDRAQLRVSMQSQCERQLWNLVGRDDVQTVRLEREDE